MNELVQRIIDLALGLIPTPYKDHAIVPNVGMDCATFPMWVYSEAGLFERPAKLPLWSPQQWLDRHKEDTQYLDWILTNTPAREITEAEVQPGDLVLYRIVKSWTHGAIVITWPDKIIHPVKGRGLVFSNGLTAGFARIRPRRFFRLVS